MARTVRAIRFTRSVTGKRPEPIAPIVLAELHWTRVQPLGDDGMIILPQEYDCEGGSDPNDLVFDWHDASYNIDRCRKATIAYEKLGEAHPNLVPYVQFPGEQDESLMLK